VSLPDIEYIDCQQTSIGLICLRERTLPTEPATVITEITLDHEFLMSSHSMASERALASIALEMHSGRSLRVLVGGLGLGYTAAEALRSERVGSVRVIEFVPQVIRWMEQGMVPLSGELNADARLELAHGDAYATLGATPGEALFDLILIDVDHSPDEWLGEENRVFYTQAGLTRAKEHLAPGGVFAVWSYAEHSPFADAMRGAFAEVRVEPISFENVAFGDTETNWLFFGRDPERGDARGAASGPG
jgi:spermidine synthase